MAVIVKAKKKSSNPTIIAPTMLVAAKVIAKRTIANKTVPKIPARRAFMAVIMPRQFAFTVSPVTNNKIAR